MSTQPIIPPSILLVDDESAFVETMAKRLTKRELAVQTALSGQEAIDIFLKKQDEIDMIVMDMVMPGMSGSETFDRLKEIKPDAKILLSSGYSIDGQATSILQRGCDGFIQKPFNLNQLAEKIQTIMPDKEKN